MHKTLSLTLAFIAIFFTTLLIFFLWRGLYGKPQILPSTLIGEPAPSFHLTNIVSPQYPFTEQNFKGHVTLLNVWATWCYACEMEHPFLMKIKETTNIPIYGILYKDNPSFTKKYLSKVGNPYTILGNDETGETSMNFGVYGTPETFLLNKQGQIIYRHVGALNNNLWQEEILPLIRALT